MPYALYADEWVMHMIRLKLDRSDRHLFTELLTHCTRNLSDGVIDVPLSLVTDHPDADAAVQRLIVAGLIEAHPDGLAIAPDYLRNQRTKVQVEADREKNRQHQEAYRERGRRHGIGDHRTCTKACPHQGQDLRKDLTKDLSNGVQSNLSPLRPKEERERGDSGKAVALGRSGQPLEDDQYCLHAYLDDGGSCRECHLPESNQRHVTFPERGWAMFRTLEGLGGDVSASYEDDWYFYLNHGPLTAIVVVDADAPDQLGRAKRITVTGPCTPAQIENASHIKPQWPGSSFRTLAGTDDVLPTLFAAFSEQDGEGISLDLVDSFILQVLGRATWDGS